MLLQPSSNSNSSPTVKTEFTRRDGVRLEPAQGNKCRCPMASKRPTTKLEIEIEEEIGTTGKVVITSPEITKTDLKIKIVEEIIKIKRTTIGKVEVIAATTKTEAAIATIITISVEIEETTKTAVRAAKRSNMLAREPTINSRTADREVQIRLRLRPRLL